MSFLWVAVVVAVSILCYKNRKLLFPWFCKETMVDGALRLARDAKKKESM